MCVRAVKVTKASKTCLKKKWQHPANKYNQAEWETSVIRFVQSNRLPELLILDEMASHLGVI